MSSTPDPIHFNPPEPAIDALIAALTDPTQSLAAVAAKHNTTADALALWLARPEVAQRLRTHESAHAARLRLTATTQLSQALQAVTKIILDFNQSMQNPRGNAGANVAPDSPIAPITPDPSNRATPSASTSDITHPTSNIAAAAMTCRATGLLLRLARYNPAPLELAPILRAAAKPQHSYYDTPTRDHSAHTYYDTEYETYTEAAEAESPQSDIANPNLAPADHPNSNAAATPAAPAPIHNPINEQTNPHPDSGVDSTPDSDPTPNPQIDLQDDDLNLDLEDDLDVDLDLDNDPALSIDLTPSERSNLPHLVQQVRHLAAIHPP